jgi:hypothetical protein
MLPQREPAAAIVNVIAQPPESLRVCRSLASPEGRIDPLSIQPAIEVMDNVPAPDSAMLAGGGGHA